ncbi:MAG: hypothetical protein R3224_08830, partial [Balneolaceae bacterium]|nr:hypothetical protein [Balneolaceae bacterium]
MPDELPSNNDTETSAIDRKWLRIFIIVAIGIPVLLELSTLFNLVTVQFWGKSDTGSAEEQHPTVEVR